jgi:hypothetical protein
VYDAAALAEMSQKVAWCRKECIDVDVIVVKKSERFGGEDRWWVSM